MSRLCPSNYMPQNISTCTDQIEVSLRGASFQIQQMYNNKQSCDLIIKLQGRQFHVHKYVVQRRSAIFWKGLAIKDGQKYIIQLACKSKVLFNSTSTQILQKILICLYGYSITIHRYEIQQAYQICKQLQLQQLQNIFHLDMLNHFDEYDIFPLLKLATQQQFDDLTELCYDQLEIEQYEPMRYNKSGLLFCDQELFKSIIKRHTYHKHQNQKFGLSSCQIDKLLEQYCDIHDIKGQLKDGIVGNIQQRYKSRYLISLTQVSRKPTTPRRTKSSSQIFFRNTLTLPRQKDQQLDSFFQLSNDRKQSKLNTQTDSQSQKNTMSPFLLRDGNMQSIEQKSICNFFTGVNKPSNGSTVNKSNKSCQNRSRKESFGSAQTDTKSFNMPTVICQNQKAIQEANKLMQVRAEQLQRRLQRQVASKMENIAKLRSLQRLFQQVKAEYRTGAQKVQQLQKTLNDIEANQHMKEVKRKFDQMFQTSIDLDLTLSTQFGLKNNTKK